MNLEGRDLSKTALVLAPTLGDSRTAVDVLKEANIEAVACSDIFELYEMIQHGCGTVIIAHESLDNDKTRHLQMLLRDQEPWSDLPIIVLTSSASVYASELLAGSGNLSILERPFSKLTLIRAAEVAIRSRERQYQVRSLMEQQEKATRTRDEFFATLSHELRTPLNVILGWLEILRSEKLDPSATREALELVERNAKMQKGLIDDLLDISRIITGKLFFKAVPSSYDHLVRSIVSSFVPRASSKNIQLKLEVPTEKVAVMGDEQRLGQVLSNLLTNAIKFTPENGKITVKLEKKDNSAVLSVQDNGQGVDPLFLPFIFDRLKQEDMSTTRSHGGLGLGLAIASHIVAQHEGTIRAHSDGRGKGMLIEVSLPILNAKLSQVEEVVSYAAAPVLSGVRVLVVDDSPDILQLIKVWLHSAKAEILTVDSAAEGLKVLPKFLPDILLSDIGMPEVDGYQFIKKVRSLPDARVRDIPAVALTAYARDEERARALGAGFQLHISKPISSRQLLAAIASLVHQKPEVSAAGRSF